MEYRYLGRSGLRVSALSFGAMTFSREGSLAQLGSTDLNEAGRQLDLCLDAGVNLFDTANTYVQSEEVMGELIAGRRDRLILATKVRFRMGDGPNDQGLSRHHLIAQCEQSLKRLRVDHIDLYQLHGWDGCTPVEETLSAMDHLVASGKVRYTGVSNFSGWHLMKTLGAADLGRLVRPISQQIYYTLAAREAEYELVPISLDQGVGMLVFSPLAGGRLSGKYRLGQAAPEGTRGSAQDWQDWQAWPVRDEETLDQVVAILLEIGESHRVSAAQIALAWLLGRPGVTSVILGARTEAQLADNLSAADLTLSADERRRLDKASEPPLLYPYWHQAKFGRDRLSEIDSLILAGRE